MLAPDGELGRIWTLSRPLTYRAIDGLVDKGLVTRRRARASGQGRDRVVLGADRRRAGGCDQRWLDTPVQHLRDVRTELLVKLALRERAGLDNDGAPRRPAGGVRARDRRAHLDGRATTTSSTCGAGRAPGPCAASSTRRSTRPSRRPAASRRCGSAPATSCAAPSPPSTTARSCRPVKAVLGDGQPLTAAITKDAADDLDLAPGDPVLVVIKSTEVMVAKAS